MYLSIGLTFYFVALFPKKSLYVYTIRASDLLLFLFLFLCVVCCFVQEVRDTSKRFCGLLLLVLLLLLYCVASRLLVLCQQTGENLGGAIGGLLAHWWVALVAVGAAVLV